MCVTVYTSYSLHVELFLGMISHDIRLHDNNQLVYNLLLAMPGD